MVVTAIPLTAEKFFNEADETSAISLGEKNVVVYSDDDGELLRAVQADLLQYTTNVVSSDDASAVFEDIAIVDNTWVKINSTEQNDRMIEEKISMGIPVIFVDCNHYIFKDSGLRPKIYGSAGDEVVSCWYQNSDSVSFRYNAGGDLSEAIKLSYAWADKIMSGDPYYVTQNLSWVDVSYKTETVTQSEIKMPLGATTSTTGETWTLVAVLSNTANYNNIKLGTYTQTTYVYKLTGLTSAYDYYSFHYYQGWARGSSQNARLADIYLMGQFSSISGTTRNCSVIASGPSSTAGTTTTSTTVSVGLGINESGPAVSFSVGKTWAYSIGDVVVKNSTTSTQLDIWHDVAESKNVGFGYQAEPSATISIPAKSSTTFANFHSIQVCQWSKILLWESWKNFVKVGFTYLIYINATTVTGAYDNI